MNFFWLLELISSAARSGSAFGMRIRETNRMRFRIRDTASDRKETDGKPWERVDLFRGFRHDDVKKSNKKKFPTGQRYHTIPIFRGKRYSLRISILL
jgi:hypothetical protein